MRAFAITGTVALSLFTAAALHSTPASADTIDTCTELAPGPQRTVARVIDGETLALDDGSQLRLVGALAPRAIDAGADPGRWPLEVAATAELEALALGKTIEIGFGGERSDRYGRLLAHAFIRPGGERRWVQGHLLEQGLARASFQAGNRACADALLASERPARMARRGLWAEAAYHVRHVSRPGSLRRYRATFQLVEGRIARVGHARSRVYLDFAAIRWPRSRFSASLRRADLALLGEHARDPAALQGRRVRVRGWIEGSDRLSIDLSASGQLEVIDAGAAAAPNSATAEPRR